MPSTVFVNSRGIPHQKSSGMSNVFPNVCKISTPTGPVPVPFPSIGKSEDATDGPESVKVEEAMPMVKGAKYCKTSGDESGTLKGVISGTTGDECEFMIYSFDVKMEKKNVCRLGDQVFHNKKNTMG